ncbi:hypothetical protein M0R45_017297 [Rubus argutus]|uniref:Uncharacterized protein n=1 Tax=Rubus argutus TaxID=59490 RepID=A0AAW1XV02_RUBAR
MYGITDDTTRLLPWRPVRFGDQKWPEKIGSTTQKIPNSGGPYGLYPSRPASRLDRLDSPLLGAPSAGSGYRNC